MLSTPQSTEQNSKKIEKMPLIVPVKEQTNHKKTIFLTFDDGPLTGTENVLQVLQREKVHATMFMVGRHIVMHQALFKKAIASPYITIANHTYSHADGHYRKFYSNNITLLRDVRHTDAIISTDKETVVHSPFHPLRLAGRNVFRLPCISCDDHGLGKCQRNQERTGYDTLAKAGFFIYGWDVEWRFNADNGQPLTSAQDIVNKVEALHKAKQCMRNDKVILLMHDFMFRDCFNGEKNLVALIQLLKQKGWEFAGIETYI